MLFLDKEILKDIITHAREESPNEACGILAGFCKGEEKRRHEVKKVFRMTNTDKSRIRFFMDPKEQLKTLKEIRALGLEMVGIYHSHPATEAYPSAHDVEMAFYPDASYVIISLKDALNPIVRSFKIADGRIEEEAVVHKS